ncbi:tubulin epsilon and delta complex protein 1 isoform X2 [Narcine bancroftii]|uniref:tubulin epsilon and delta complex protein 1 isoform X2 n=1 Tax=Narcine bancroftii TaxID=1343680 RepID=UPI0038321BCA
MSVKAAITALCRVLAGVEARTAAPLSPEIFRQAKFDRKEVTVEFWKLLFRLLNLVSENKNCAVTDLAHQIEYVKAAVCYYGYGFLDFYQLPADGTWGSRDLLLVFSWLLQKIHLLEKLLVRQKLCVDDQLSLCMCRQTTAVRTMERSDSQDGRHSEGMDIRYLQWLHGKLRFRWKSLYSAQQEQCATLHKIHLYTRGCRSGQSFDHLSATETHLIQDPVRCTELLQLLEYENLQLEVYLEWKQLEPLFWQWMESVLAAKLQDSQDLLNVKNTTAMECSLDQSGDHVDLVTFREMDDLSCELLKLQMKLQDWQKTKSEKSPDQWRRRKCTTDVTGKCSIPVRDVSGAAPSEETASKDTAPEELDKGVQQLQSGLCQLTVTAQDANSSPALTQHCRPNCGSQLCSFPFNSGVPRGGSDDSAETQRVEPGASSTPPQGLKHDINACPSDTEEEHLKGVLSLKKNSSNEKWTGASSSLIWACAHRRPIGNKLLAPFMLSEPCAATRRHL